MFPEEFTAFDADLAEMEQQQRIYDRSGRLQTKGASVGEKVKDAIVENIPSMEDLKSIPGNIIDSPYNPNLLKQMRKPDVPQGGVDAPYADEAGAYDTSQAGSSIMNSQTMNPGAAQALYTGNTDAALAAQYGGGTQYAAGGGLMELNPVMNNQGKYVDPQKGINDNPFQKAQNKGILGVL